MSEQNIAVRLNNRIAELEAQIANIDVTMAQSLNRLETEKNQRIAELEAKLSLYRSPGVHREQFLLETISRNKELEAQVAEHAAFAFAAGELAGKRELRIKELEERLERTVTDYKNLRDTYHLEQESSDELAELLRQGVNHVETLQADVAAQAERIAELEQMNNDLTAAYSNLQQAAFKLADATQLKDPSPLHRSPKLGPPQDSDQDE